MSQTMKEIKDEMYKDSIMEEFDRVVADLYKIEPRSIKPSGVKYIQNDRQNDYGDAKKSFNNIAAMWSAYLSRRFNHDIFVDGTDVATLMTLMKASRFAYQRKEDTALDMAAYADFALKFTEKKNED